MSWQYLKYTSFEAWKNVCVNTRLRSREKLIPSDVADKTVIVTGATNGIGREVAIKLASAGANLILACRNMEAAEEVKAHIMTVTGNKAAVKIYNLNVDSFDSVRSFVSEIKEKESVVDILINNAGAICHDPVNGEHPHQISMRTNYFGHVLLSLSLIDFMMSTSKHVPRIVNLGTIGHMNIKEMDLSYLSGEKTIDNPLLSYAFAKACLLMFTRELAKKVHPKARIVAADPGVSLTPGYRTMFRSGAAKWISEGPLLAPFRRNVTEAADSVIFAAVGEKQGSSPDFVYFVDGNFQVMSPICLDENVRQSVWNKTKEILNLPIMDTIGK